MASSALLIAWMLWAPNLLTTAALLCDAVVSCCRCLASWLNARLQRTQRARQHAAAGAAAKAAAAAAAAAAPAAVAVGVTAAAAVAATVSRRTAGTAGARRAAETGAGTDGAAAAAGIVGGADWSCDSSTATAGSSCGWSTTLPVDGVGGTGGCSQLGSVMPPPAPCRCGGGVSRTAGLARAIATAGTDGAAAAARSATGGCCCSSETAASARSRVGAAAAAAAPRPSVGTSETGGFSSHFRARHAAPWPLLLWWLPLPGYAAADAVATVAAHCCRQASKCTSPVVGSACLVCVFLQLPSSPHWSQASD